MDWDGWDGLDDYHRSSRSSKSAFGANNRPILKTLSQPILPGNFSLFPQLSLSVRNLGPSWTILIEQQQSLSDPSLIQSMSLEWIFTVSCFSFVLIGSEWAGIYIRHNVKVSLNRQLSLPGAPSPICQASTTDTTKVRSSQAHKTSWWAHRPTPTHPGAARTSRRDAPAVQEVSRCWPPIHTPHVRWERKIWGLPTFCFNTNATHSCVHTYRIIKFIILVSSVLCLTLKRKYKRKWYLSFGNCLWWPTCWHMWSILNDECHIFKSSGMLK